MLFDWIDFEDREDDRQPIDLTNRHIELIG
jgi:hypothetical protein